MLPGICTCLRMERIGGLLPSKTLESKNLTPAQPANVTDIKPGKYVIICIELNV